MAKQNGHMAESIRPKIDQVLFELHAAPDESLVAMLRHENEPEAGFQAYVEAVRERISRGDLWAGCEVIVLARYASVDRNGARTKYAGMSSCLRGVSMSSSEDFASNHPDFERLRTEAFTRLIINMTLDESIHELPPRDPIPNAKR